MPRATDNLEDSVKHMFIAVTSIALSTTSSVAQDCDPSEPFRVLSPNGHQLGGFGYAVALAEDIAVVGEHLGTNNSGVYAGSASIFRHEGSTWVREALLFANDGFRNDRFGASVDLAQDTVVIGVLGDDDLGAGSGSVYVYRYNGHAWMVEAKLLPSDGEAGDRFGTAVAISDNTIVVGSPFDQDGGPGSGSAIVFQFNGFEWIEQYKLIASDTDSGGLFGWSVAILDDTIVVGSPQSSDNGPGSGSVYVFRYNGLEWEQQARLLPAGGEEGDEFGYSVAVSKNIVVAGAPRSGRFNQEIGSAFVFKEHGRHWIQQAKLEAKEGADHDLFGWSVGVSGNIVVAGAMNETNYSNAKGYVFQTDGAHWRQAAKLQGSTSQAADAFGGAVSVSNGHALIGAPGDEENGWLSGAEYFIDLDCLAECLADVTGSNDPADSSFGVPDGILNEEDFFFYIRSFTDGSTKADLSGSVRPGDLGYCVPDGMLDANDFFFYTELFAAGCP